MAKVLIFLILCGFVMLSKTQSAATGPSENDGDDVIQTSTLSPEDEALQFNDAALKIISGRLAVANLPPELAPAGQQILANATEGLEQCEENLRFNHSIWQYKVCAAAQLRNALTAIKVLQMASLQPLPSSGAAA